MKVWNDQSYTLMMFRSENVQLSEDWGLIGGEDLVRERCRRMLLVDAVHWNEARVSDLFYAVELTDDG